LSTSSSRVVVAVVPLLVVAQARVVLELELGFL
jgi:hypothetical protein